MFDPWRNRRFVGTLVCLTFGATGLVATPTAAGATAAPAPDAISRSVSPPVVKIGTPFVISGRISPVAPGVVVTLELSRGRAWTTVATTRSSATGAYAISHTNAALGTTLWRVRRAPGTPKSVTSAPVSVLTVSRAFAVSVAIDHARILRGDKFGITGTVSPAAAGGSVTLQQQVGTTWTSVARATLTAGTSYRFTRSVFAQGPAHFRVVKPNDARLAPGVSAVSTLIVTGTGSSVVPRIGTVIGTAAQTASVTGNPSGAQTTVLVAGAPTPPVGGHLVLPASPNAPQGLLGTVVSVTANADGSQTVETTPATLDAAYSTFVISRVGAMTAIPPTAASSHLRYLSSLNSAVDFECTTGAGPTVSLTADLSHISADFYLNIAIPSIYFSIDALPTFTLSSGFTGAATCTLKAGVLSSFRLPISVEPPLELTARPVLAIEASGKVTINTEWSPHLIVGFGRGVGPDENIHTFASHGSANATGEAGLSVSAGFALDVSLAGRVGIGGTVGPQLEATATATDSAPAYCFKIAAALSAQIQLSVDVWVSNWDAAVARGVFGERIIYDSCRPQVHGPGWHGTLTFKYHHGGSTQFYTALASDYSVTYSADGFNQEFTCGATRDEVCFVPLKVRSFAYTYLAVVGPEPYHPTSTEGYVKYEECFVPVGTSHQEHSVGVVHRTDIPEAFLDMKLDLTHHRVSMQASPRLLFNPSGDDPCAHGTPWPPANTGFLMPGFTKWDLTTPWMPGAVLQAAKTAVGSTQWKSPGPTKLRSFAYGDELEIGQYSVTYDLHRG